MSLRPATRRLLAIALLAIAVPAQGYVRSTMSSDGTFLLWDTGGAAVTFRLHPEGSSDVAGGSDLRALESAFDRWEVIPTCAISFERGADFPDRTIANDGVNAVFFLELSTLVDGADVSGALAVTYNYFYTSGPQKGRIIDSNIAFNGVEFTWTTDPSNHPSSYDVESVAAHEIGHLLGLDHSPVGASTMFPRTPPGLPWMRFLHPDDMAGCSVIYPDSSFPSRGGIAGTIRDRSSNPVFGVHVLAEDPDGNAIAGALSWSDGSYRIADLSPGTYRVRAEPIASANPSLFSTSNLGSWWSTARTSVLPSGDSLLAVQAAQESRLDFMLDSAAPSGRIVFIGNPALQFRNAPAQLSQGASGVRVGVAGPGLPTSGSPLAISGTGITVAGTQFGTVGGYPAITLTLDVAANAAPGARTFLVTKTGERILATGHLEILSGDDRDGDHISNADEGDGTVDTDGDITTDDLDTDSDEDGIPDAVEGGDLLTSTPPWDSDGDTTPDFRDFDSDGDTIHDGEELLSDPDSDEEPAFRDLDSDGDGIPDAVEAGDAFLGTPAWDSDGDTTPDFLSIDSDSDTLSDAQEAGPVPATPSDTDGDGSRDFRDPDADGDTIADAAEAGDTSLLTPPVDTDGDTISDFRDLDSDADTVRDADEAGPCPGGACDTDGDRTADFRDLDADADTIPDRVEAGDGLLATPPADFDGDGTPDLRDTDSDADALSDAVEAGDTDPATPPVDSDGDGTPDFHDSDSDDDGIADGTWCETPVDFDGDGAANFRDTDSDNGGEPDGSEIQNGRDPLNRWDDVLPGPPGPVPDGTLPRTSPLRLWVAAGGVLLQWDPAPLATDYRVFRGRLLDLRTRGYAHVASPAEGFCSTAGTFTWIDPTALTDGVAHYYLVAGMNTYGIGPLGGSDLDGDGTPEAIPPGDDSACP